jgi:hypothetical protein
MNDLRYAFRQLLRNSGFAAVAVLSSRSASRARNGLNLTPNLH